MRLASKIFLTSALVIVVLAGVAALSLRAIDRLVSANRDIVTRTVPALRLTAAAREAIEPLMRLEARAVAVGDAHYTTAWTERAAQVADDLERLGEYAQSGAERLYLREASAAFDGYRRVVAQERALVQMGDRRGAVRLTDIEARVLAERVEERLGALMSATHTRVLAVEADAARVESRMWTSVFCALGAAVGLALIGAAFQAHRMTRSLNVLSGAAAAVASGKFREPIAIKSRDEIGSLARSFNSMVGQLRRVEETRRDFFATVAAPLAPRRSRRRRATSRGRSRAAQRQAEAAHRHRSVAQGACCGVNRSSRCRLQAGLLVLERTSLDLASGRSGRRGAVRVPEVTVTLECERIGSDFSYSGDLERLHQVLVNLGANAIRFTRPATASSHA
jgi:HAMP domain-containing protein